MDETVTRRFEIGERVWTVREYPHYDTLQLCSDCLGQKAVTLIMGDGTHVSIACENCKEGLYPTGQ